MKLSEHVDHIRTLIYKAFSNQFSRLGLGPDKMMDIGRIPSESHNKREKIEVLIKSHTGETGSYSDAREKALDELTFTLFNRLAAVKVMEAHRLFPPIVTKQAEHGSRSFGHKVWLETNPEMRNAELEGLRLYLKYEFNKLGESIPLYSKDYPYALLPFVIELNEIVEAFNAVAEDNQIEDEIWQSDDILGWLYESYNNVKKQAHKDSSDKTEYNKVSLQSQWYTPRWVVEFLINNSLGKLYLEMYPESEIKDKYKIANVPKTKVRVPKPLHEVKLIDPTSGSGNFLLYGFSFFYALYIDQIENYGADYDEDDIPQLIIENNLNGIDLDDRAIQLAQLGLWIKAKQKNRQISSLNFNLVSSDFNLPDYETVEYLFTGSADLNDIQLNIIKDTWTDLQNAHKFGSLIKINERIKQRIEELEAKTHGRKKDLFTDEEINLFENFEVQFFDNLFEAVDRYAHQTKNTFLANKTKDAITFLKLLTQKYDVATANPPYTDSGDFGPDLKKFINTNYKKPYKFHTNLYATFIKRCFELTNEKGNVAMVHPPTFMYIKTFEDVRKFMLEKSHIDLFVEWGYLGMFHPSARVDSAMYILNKQISDSDTTFIKLNDIYEGKRYDAFAEAYDDLVDGKQHSNNYFLPQPKLKIIKSWPFIYWISDEFREKFGYKELEEVLKAKKGLGTQSERFFRFWWEVDKTDISKYYPIDQKKWVRYVKGGPFRKWFGNIWLILNWDEDGKEIKIHPKTNMRNPDTYFKTGIAGTLLSSKGPSFRYQPKNIIYDSTTRSIFFEDTNKVNENYILGYLNSKLCSYILNCLNSTVVVNSNDIHRVPLVIPENSVELLIGVLVETNINIRKKLTEFIIYEYEFIASCISIFESTKNQARIKNFFDFENNLNTQILLNEAIINIKIFDVYELTDLDNCMVISQEGKSIGAMPLSIRAKNAYLEDETSEFPIDNIRDFIQNLPEKEFTSNEREAIENEFPQLYQSNNNLEEFCIRHQINPINVWYWFKESNIIPRQRMNDLAMEFLADLLREILMEDEDGIIPLVPNAGEKVLLDRIEEKFIEKGFSLAQYSSFDSVLGRELNDYINNHFFKVFSDHLNLFQYLPKTPFIWHLSSGPEQGFDCYIIIYKWNRDKLLAIRSKYIENRERALINRQTDLRKKELLSAAEQTEADKIYNQLKEIESFKQKIDELLAEGYNPILDDGVGKNIAPLQSKEMIPYKVLNKGQLKKYLNADW